MNPVVQAVFESPTHTILTPVVGVVSSDLVITQFSIVTLSIAFSSGVNSENIALSTIRNVAREVIL